MNGSRELGAGGSVALRAHTSNLKQTGSGEGSETQSPASVMPQQCPSAGPHLPNQPKEHQQLSTLCSDAETVGTQLWLAFLLWCASVVPRHGLRQPRLGLNCSVLRLPSPKCHSHFSVGHLDTEFKPKY